MQRTAYSERVEKILFSKIRTLKEAGSVLPQIRNKILLFFYLLIIVQRAHRNASLHRITIYSQSVETSFGSPH